MMHVVQTKFELDSCVMTLGVYPQSPCIIDRAFTYVTERFLNFSDAVDVL